MRRCHAACSNRLFHSLACACACAIQLCSSDEEQHEEEEEHSEDEELQEQEAGPSNAPAAGQVRAEGLEVRPEAWVRVTTAATWWLLGFNMYTSLGWQFVVLSKFGLKLKGAGVSSLCASAASGVVSGQSAGLGCTHLQAWQWNQALPASQLPQPPLTLRLPALLRYRAARGPPPPLQPQQQQEVQVQGLLRLGLPPSPGRSPGAHEWTLAWT